MKIKTISSFDEYIKYTEPYKGRYYFRGQADAAWDITPSLFRYGAASLESDRQVIHNELVKNSKITPLSALFHAQHYGTPTRICDLTISHLCALFFASDGDTNGAVYIMDKSKTITTSGYEMSLFTTVLTNDINKISELPYDDSPLPPTEVLSQNYVVVSSDLNFSNDRAFRQGGTGIVFGFNIDNDNINPIGKGNVNELIVEKIIILQSAKKDIADKLKHLGYSSEILYNEPEEKFNFEKTTLTETEFEVNERFDTEKFNKIAAKYCVNTLYFDRDTLCLQIAELYKELFRNHGVNARVWTFFYYDDNDIINTNWICRGEWPRTDGYEIKWNKSYQSFRLNYMNEQISRNETMSRFSNFAAKIEPFYDQVYKYISNEDYDVPELFALAKRIQQEVRKIFLAAGDIPRADVSTEGFTEAAYMFIANIDWVVGDMVIYAGRTDLKEQYIKWSILRMYIPACEKSKQEYLRLLNLQNGH